MSCGLELVKATHFFVLSSIIELGLITGGSIGGSVVLAIIVVISIIMLCLLTFQVSHKLDSS